MKITIGPETLKLTGFPPDSKVRLSCAADYDDEAVVHVLTTDKDGNAGMVMPFYISEVYED